MDYYKTKYRFQWWWYSGGGQVAVENATMTVLLFIGAYAAWCFAYLMEP